MRAVAYLRVSTEDQAASGAGLNAQLDACRAHADRAGWGLVGPYVDEGISGAAPLDKRPALIEALAEIGKGDVLLVAKRDRLGRDPIAIATIEGAIVRKKGRVVSAAGQGTEDDGPESILMRRIVDAFGEYERLLIKARTLAALGAKKRRGERTGKVPYGFDLAEDGKSLVENAEERRTLALMAALKAGGMSLRGIATELTRRGIPTKEGKPEWRNFVVAKLLKRDP